MEIDFGIIPLILSSALILFAIYFLLYYRFVYSIIDPLFIWIFTTSFASVLAIQVIPTLEDIIHFFGCQLSLWIGFVVAYRKVKYSHNGIGKLKEVFKFSDQSLLKWITYMLLIVYLISNLIIGYSKGFALFSGAPSESKIANFQEGFGFFRKINWSVGTFVYTSLMFMYFLKKRFVDLFFLVVVIFFSSLDGSKGALLQIAISAGIIFYHPAFSSRRIELKNLQRYMPLLLIAVMSLFFSILLKENDGPEAASLAFIKRLLYTSDSVLYFYTPINLSFFENYSFWEYFPRLVNPILGFLRIQPYQEAIGNTMYDNLRIPGTPVTSVTVGPNAPFYIEGRIFFYYWGAFPYSALVGYLYASIRTHFFSITRTSSFYFVYMATFLHLAQAVIIDVNLAVTQSFDLLFFVFPSYIFVSFLLRQKLILRLGKNSVRFFKINQNFSR